MSHPLIEHTATVEEPYYSALMDGSLSQADFQTMLKERNNIASEWKIKLVVVK